jgi:hypothetical protein
MSCVGRCVPLFDEASKEQMLELVVCAFAGLVALRRESEDWMKVEQKRADVLKGVGGAEDMLAQVERVRRVTWRMGVLGSLVLAATLVAMRVIQMDQIVLVAVPSWVVVTSVLNFRAYHVEDEGTLVARALAK